MQISSVLLVDDEPDIRIVGEIALSQIGGWDVTVACDGREAIAAVRSNQPDVILLDMMMPGMDGMQTLAHLKADPRTFGVPVIFMTAKVLPVEVERYMDSGAIGVVPKPYDPVSLPVRVAEIFNQSMATKVDENGR